MYAVEAATANQVFNFCLLQVAARRHSVFGLCKMSRTNLTLAMPMRNCFFFKEAMRNCVDDRDGGTGMQ